MRINLATWAHMHRALAVTLMVALMVALSIHTAAGTAKAGPIEVNGRATKNRAIRDGGAMNVEPASALVPLQIFIQAKPAFSPTRPAIVGHGDIITYTLVVTNSSGVTQTGLVLTDVVPLGSTALTSTVKPSPAQAPSNGVGSWVWRITALEPGQTMTMSHAVRVNDLITVTAIVNVAQVRSDQTVPVNSNTTVHLFGGPPDPPPELWRYFLATVTR